MLIRYRTTGTLTGTIEPENVAQAMAYLVQDDMTQYLLDPTWGEQELIGVVEHVRWQLNPDGHTWYVEALTTRELTEGENRALAQWVSGQNSDGLGEGFEQQDFAWNKCEGCEACDENPWDDCGEGVMTSFDWQTNELSWERVS